ncbi:alpha/beta fold hydrolase [Actinoplanes sp. NPDC051494]|uniref:alpha/beta fold hydrolase n=1 Tax=Actinoplanes sp. NPDC051494 TaxID=3363907 RepID=UPI0037A92A27
MKLRMSRRTAIIATATVALLGAVTVPAMATTTAKEPKPTIVLVHGAFADSSSWGPVIQKLRADGYPVTAVANPLRGISADAAYVSSFLQKINGPIVLVGHSYGGAVITNAATSDPDIKSLVYIAAFAPAKNEKLIQLTSSTVPPLPLKDTAAPGSIELSIDPAQFPAKFAADVDRTTAEQMALTQRPVSFAAFDEPSAVEGYRTVPSWYLLTRDDQAIGADLQRRMAVRAGSTVTETNASHAVMISKPGVVAKIIEQAAR